MRRIAMLVVVTVGCRFFVPECLTGDERSLQSPETDVPAHAAAERGPRIKVALLAERLPGANDGLAPALARQLRDDGLEVTELSAEQVCDAKVLSSQAFDLYVIPRCQTYPAAGFEALRAFAGGGGHLLLLGGPLLDDPLWHGRQGWLDRAAIEAAKQNVNADHHPFDTASLDTSRWMRTSNDIRSPGEWRVVSEGPQRTPCLRFATSNLTGWDGYLSPPITQLYGTDDDLLTFLARGDARTTQLAVEIQESDGSRWMAVSDMGTEWQRISLEVRDFSYWPDSPTGNRRGRPGDLLNPAQARRINFQLSQSHTPAVAPGEHTFWIADVGTCRSPIADIETPLPGEDSSLETIYPRYKVVTLAERLSLQPLASCLGLFDTRETSWTPVSANDIVCAIPRTMGRGFMRGQKWRYLPLLEAIDAEGRARGNPAWMLLNQAAPYDGSVFACVGINDQETISSPEVLRIVSRITGRLAQGVFLKEAGSDHFAYWPGEPIRIGATAVNVGRVPRSVSLRVTLSDAAGNLLLARTAQLQLAGRQQATWDEQVSLPGDQPAVFRVTIEMQDHDTVVDRIEHELAILDSRVCDRSEFMTVQGNRFQLHGRAWYPIGMNYWPLYVSGMDRQDYWAGWIQRPYYEPELVEEDLARMQSLGINMVSIQANDPKFYRNLLDFIRRCARHDIYVNLFCGLASPLGFREEELRRFIETARLANNPAIMAYDTIWEPGNYVFQGDRRGAWDDQWRDWVVEQYGSIDAAEQDWGFQGRHDAQDRLSSPPDQYFREDGPWRTMMAAYRRFMDDLTSRKWNRAHRKLRQIDPNHLISFRQGNTLPHDFVFTGTPKHIDFICPEGYAIPDSDEGYYAAGFITRFVHFTTRGKPVVWSEFGQSVWDPRTMSPSPRRIEEVARYHEMFYRMTVESGANGTVPWWWPGGYRVGERSDFGVMNPDGTPRPAAELIRKYAPLLMRDRAWPAPTVWFDMDLDANAGGYWYVCFHTGRDAYRSSVEKQEHLGIRTQGTGTNSADTPLVAVGNRPATGSNPLKYLNAEFNWLQILDASGRWAEAEDGASIVVATGAAVRARICVGNTQEATWLAATHPGDPESGTVVLTTTKASQISGRWPLRAETPYLSDADFGEVTLHDAITAPVSVELRMAVIGRSDFGEKRSFTLVPAK